MLSAAKESHVSRVKNLVKEALVTLLRNSMPYDSELCIEGLLGLTIDKTDILLVNINEVISKTSEQTSSTSSQAVVDAIDGHLSYKLNGTTVDSESMCVISDDSNLSNIQETELNTTSQASNRIPLQKRKRQFSQTARTLVRKTNLGITNGNRQQATFPLHFPQTQISTRTSKKRRLRNVKINRNLPPRSVKQEFDEHFNCAITSPNCITGNNRHSERESQARLLNHDGMSLDYPTFTDMDSGYSHFDYQNVVTFKSEPIGETGAEIGNPGDKQLYDCHICLVSFSKKFSLKRHIETKHDNMGTMCYDCQPPSWFSRRDSLLRHIKVFHGSSTLALTTHDDNTGAPHTDWTLLETNTSTNLKNNCWNVAANSAPAS